MYEAFALSSLDIFLRLLTALLVGMIIGIERKKKHKPIGTVTIALVCLGAAILACYQDLIVEDSIKVNFYLWKVFDYSPIGKVERGRVVAQIISGVGFLGAGAILHDKMRVQGITTAATLWVAAALGIVIGSGFWMLSFFSFLFVLVALLAFKPLEGTLLNKRELSWWEISYTNEINLALHLSKLDIHVYKTKTLAVEVQKNKIIYHDKISLFIPKYITNEVFEKFLNSKDDILELVFLKRGKDKERKVCFSKNHI